METAAIISLSGVLAAAFLPTFIRHLRFSKVSEATEKLDAIYRGTAAYYATERRRGVRTIRGCLPPSVGPTPAEPSVDPVHVDFALEDALGSETWIAIGQSEPGLLRYSYQLVVAEPGCGPRDLPVRPAVTIRALGDLDGDGEHSVLEREAVISRDQRSLVATPPLRIIRRTE